MKTRNVRALITGAGGGSSGNLIRGVRDAWPKAHVVGINSDRFSLKMSLADKNYLCPKPSRDEFIATIAQIIKRERIGVVMPTDDDLVRALSDDRERLPVELLLPRRETIDLCQDKYALNVFLRRRGIPAPLTHEVKSLRGVDGIFSRFPRTALLWCRTRHGARSLAATPVATAEQARAWMTQWRDLRGIKVSNFTIAEFLPGRHFMVQSIWHRGELLRAQAIEILGYFAAGNNPSGVFSLASLAKTVVAPEAVQVALSAVRALEEGHPSGAFFAELKERADGVPAITEINAGRFPSGVTALLALGRDNMIAMFASAAAGSPVKARNPLGCAEEHYLVRDIDALPRVFSASELQEGIGGAT
jgi:carbamoyl-phosphate synthase large subunit